MTNLEQSSLNLQAATLPKNGHSGAPGWVSVVVTADEGNLSDSPLTYFSIRSDKTAYIINKYVATEHITINLSNKDTKPALAVFVLILVDGAVLLLLISSVLFPILPLWSTAEKLNCKITSLILFLEYENSILTSCLAFSALIRSNFFCCCFQRSFAKRSSSNQRSFCSWWIRSSSSCWNFSNSSCSWTQIT